MQDIKLKYHIAFWLIYWISQSLLMGGGKHLEFYFPKEVAMVSLQMLVVYANWFFLYPLLFQRKRYVLYGLLGVALVYLVFVFSFSWIIVVLKSFQYFIPAVPLPDFPPLSFKYRFWAFLSSSAPYSLALVVSLAVKIFHESDKNKKQAKVLEIEKARTEIQYLRSQINPHFLFNSLNNIHTLILKDQHAASEYTLLLSELLRYMLYEVKKEKTELRNEIQCLKNYFELVKMRTDSITNLPTGQAGNTFTFELEHLDLPIAPLLLTSLVENGIKHSGIEYCNDAWFNLHIHEADGQLNLLMKNSIGEIPKQKLQKSESNENGIGLSNLKKRLALNYPMKHEFEFKKGGREAITQLQLNLSE